MKAVMGVFMVGVLRSLPPRARGWPGNRMSSTRKKTPRKGFLAASQEKLLLDASLVFFILFFGAVDFFVVHLAAAMATREGRRRHQHESGNESSDRDFHKNTFKKQGWKKSQNQVPVQTSTRISYQALKAHFKHGQIPPSSTCFPKGDFLP
jgi:hypothetical protein